MNICFATEHSLNAVWQEKLQEVSDSDLLVFGFNGLGLVSYKKELSGETEYFHDLAKLSKQLSAVVISGCDTDTYGVFRHSAVIADNGKLLGVTDMVHSVDDSEFVAGGNYRVYDTSIGKIGIIVGEDLYFTESATVLALCDADLIVCLAKKQETLMPQIMIRALSYANGVPMCLCAGGYSVLSDIRGNISIAGAKEFIKTKVKTEREYHDVFVRKRGLTRDTNPV